MSEIEDKTQSDALEDNLSQEFHTWKHENIVTKIVFKYLRDEIDAATTVMQRNAMIPDISFEQKLAQYHILSAKIQYFNEILNLTYDEIKELRGDK